MALDSNGYPKRPTQRLSQAVAVQPTTLAEQTRSAIEEGLQNQAALVRRYMTWLAEEIERQAPNLIASNQSEWDDLFLAALAGSLTTVVEFAQLAEAVASMNAADAARAVYKGMDGILALYQPPRGFSGTFQNIAFDFAKFIGHELFVSFFSLLIREERWELIADLFEEDIYIENTPHGQPGVVTFDYVSQHLAVLDHRKQRLKLNRLSLHADLLNERHTQGDLARLVPMSQFTDADFFLFLRAQLQEPTSPRGLVWRAWSYLYARQVPRYLVGSTRARVAQQLLRPLGIADVQTFRDRFAERASRVGSLFSGGFWENPLWAFDPQTIGSR